MKKIVMNTSMSSVTLSSDKKTTPTSPQSQPPQEAPANRGLGLSRIWDSYGMLVVFAVVFIGCVIFVPNFGSFINMKGLGLAISMSGMVACGMLFCLASGDFDLSVASVIACAGVTTAVVINMTESLWLGGGGGFVTGRIVWSDQRFCHCPAEDKCPDNHSGDHANCSWSGLYHF